MWNRWELKERAKSVLSVSYWKAFLVSLIFGLTSGRNGISFNFSQMNTNNFNQTNANYFFGDFDMWLSLPFIAALAGTFLSISLLWGLISILVFNPLEIGLRRYFLESTQMRFHLEDITRGFTTERYRNIVIAMLLRGIYNTLWYLLLIIPGIVKSYSYAMVPYLLAENPGIPPNRAIEMSMQMTAGHKWKMFVLDLSFIGWFLLGALALGIGSLFVLPYFNTTHAQLYVALRTIALDQRIISLQELEGY